jgi:anti-sigma-K factor RskA
MKEQHIIDILERAPLAALRADELAAVRAHTAGCRDCLRAYEAARVSARLLKERAAETFEPSPFFQTRVLAALKERQAANEAWPLRRMWRTAGALVSSMAAAVAALAVFTFVAPAPPTTTGPEVVSAYSSYAAEDVVFDGGELPDERMSDGQVLATIYEADEDVEQ